MKTSRKKGLLALSVVILSVTLSSCATVFGGRITEHQKQKPLPGKLQREIRVSALIADVLLFWPGAVVDFATGVIYRPVRATTVRNVSATEPVTVSKQLPLRNRLGSTSPAQLHRNILSTSHRLLG